MTDQTHLEKLPRAGRRDAARQWEDGETPYCFRVGDTPVRVSFQPDGEPLERKLKAYFLGLKA